MKPKLLALLIILLAACQPVSEELSNVPTLAVTAATTLISSETPTATPAEPIGTIIATLTLAPANTETPIATNTSIATETATPTNQPTHTPTATTQPTATTTPTTTPTPGPSPTPTPYTGIAWPPIQLPPGTHDVLFYVSEPSEPYDPLQDGLLYVPLTADGQPLSEPQSWTRNASGVVRLLPSPNFKLLTVWGAGGPGDSASVVDPITGHFQFTEPEYTYPNGFRFLGWAPDSSGVFHAWDADIAFSGQEGHLFSLGSSLDEWAYGAGLSPDGRFLIYSLDAGHTGGTWRLDLATQEREKLLDYAIHRATWSPDGQWVAFMARQELFIMRPDATNIQSVSDEIEWHASFPIPMWSPQSDSLVFVIENSITERAKDVVGHTFARNVHVVGINDQGVSTLQIAVAGSEYGYIDPSWSPDGNFLLVTGGTQDNSEIYLVGRDRQLIRQLTFGGGRKRHPVWLRLTTNSGPPQ